MSGVATPKQLPEWADRVRRKYLRGESALFLLHDNVFDAVVHEGRLWPLVDYLAGPLLDDNKRNILVYDPSSRVRVVKKAPDAVGFEALVGKRSPADVLPALEEILLTNTSTALIVPYAESVAPPGEMQFLSEQDRVAIATLHRWSLDARLAARDVVVFLVAGQLASVHPMLVSNPRVATVHLGLPDEEERREVCRLADPSLAPAEVAELARHTAGLKAVQIHGVLSPDVSPSVPDDRRAALIRELLGASPDAAARATKLAGLTREMSESEIRHLIDPGAPAGAEKADAHREILRLVHTRKREIIETECFGLIEFMDAKHDFSAVGGMTEIKAELVRVAEAIRAGDVSRVPMGLLFVGPMGTGKTFIANAFAKESQITAVKLKNFRSKWVGSTEANLEKVLGIVRALGPILLVIDEGERSFGDDGGSDGGTSSRVIARIKEFMSDPDNRGRVVFVLMTNRPDKLDADIKRAGRLDRKIPFFYATTAEEIEGILVAQLRRHGVATTVELPRDRESVSAPLVGFSNADLEAIVLVANDLAHRAGGPVTAETFASAIRDYLPSRDESMLRYMELLAVFEASSRGMLPAKYRDMTNEQLDLELRRARIAVGA